MFKMKSLTRFLEKFPRYTIAIHNLGFFNTIKIIYLRLFPQNKIQQINTKKFGKIYWRPKLDFGVMTHFFNPQVGLDTINDKINVILDIGSNIGIETIRFRKLFPYAKIISIEANKGNYEILKKNVKDDKNISTLNIAIWNEKTRLKLKKFSKVNSESFSYEKFNSTERNEVHEIVEADTIQSVCNNFSISDIDILKIDVEGAEEFIFDSSCDLWISKVNVIIIECDKNFPFTIMKIFDTFKRNNLFFKTHINGENLVFIKKGCDWNSLKIEFY